MSAYSTNGLPPYLFDSQGREYGSSYEEEGNYGRYGMDGYKTASFLSNNQQQLFLLPRPQVVEVVQEQAVQQEQVQETKQVAVKSPAKEKADPVAMSILAPEKAKAAEKILDDNIVKVFKVEPSFEDSPAMQTYFHKNGGGIGAFARDGILNENLQQA